MRTKQSSIRSLLAGVDQAEAENKYNIARDLKLLHAQYAKTSRRDYLQLLRTLIEKYEIGPDADIDAALRRRCLAGDPEAIRLYDERNKAAAGGAREVSLIDDV